MKNPLVRQGAGIALRLAAIFLFFPILALAQDSSTAVRKILVKTPVALPSLARSMHLAGVVKLDAVVEPNGTVKSVDVKGGHPLLTQCAVTAVGHWKFEPAAHETRELIEIKFDTE
jgi:TonB family protein